MVALPPLPDLAVTLLPPRAPSPPTAVTFTAFTASPVLPVWAFEADCAPELAFDTALPTATALPVRPELPVSPDRASASMVAFPLIAVFDAETLTWTSPVRPVEPESPEVAAGLEKDVDDAGPVLPVFVADDCATAAPELPDAVNGSMCRITDPPAPPLADATAMESPPTAFLVAAWAGGAANASRLIAPIRPASTPSRDLRRIWSLPLLPLLDACSLPRVRRLWSTVFG
jgi:hypothetical protein